MTAGMTIVLLLVFAAALRFDGARAAMAGRERALYLCMAAAAAALLALSALHGGGASPASRLIALAKEMVGGLVREK